jgi:hypothetical protein
MQIPVLLMFPQSVANTAMSPAADGAASGFPEGFTPDPDFSAMAIGDTVTSQSMVASAGGDIGAAAEQMVAVRGFIEGNIEDPPRTIGDYTVYADPEIDTFLTCIGDPPVGNSADVAAKLDVAGLTQRGMDGTNVAIAIVDTGINLAHLTNALGYTPNLDTANSWTPPRATLTAGNYPLGHGTMCAFDVLIAAPKATLIDVPVLSARLPGSGSVMSATLSAALLAYSAVLTSWNSGAGSGDLSQYAGLVLSNSWGIFHPSWDFPAGHPGRYIDNPKHPFMLQLEAMSRGGIDVFFAAGNCGADCPDGRCQNNTTQVIMGASASIDVMSIAGCDTNDSRVGYSSQGPSIPGIPPGTKPDITSYTHFLGSQAFGVGVADSGTSAACPVAAGCMAALRTRISPRSPATPYMVYDNFRLNTQLPAGLATGWNADYGFGIIRPVPVADLYGPWTI